VWQDAPEATLSSWERLCNLSDEEPKDESETGCSGESPCARPVHGKPEHLAALASTDAIALVELVARDKHLVRLAAAWPTMPKAIRRMMVALLDRG